MGVRRLVRGGAYTVSAGGSKITFRFQADEGVDPFVTDGIFGFRPVKNQ
jgi:hypothetical protein